MNHTVTSQGEIKMSLTGFTVSFDMILNHIVLLEIL